MRIVFRCDPALRDHLPPPLAARAALPDWLRAMPNRAFSPIHGQEVRTVKQCPPFVDAMAYGFVMPLPCDATVAWAGPVWLRTRTIACFDESEHAGVAGPPLIAGRRRTRCGPDRMPHRPCR